MQEVGGWLGGNLQRLQTRGEGLPSAPDAGDLDVTSVSPDAQNECLFLVLPQANVHFLYEQRGMMILLIYVFTMLLRMLSNQSGG